MLLTFLNYLKFLMFFSFLAFIFIFIFFFLNMYFLTTVSKNNWKLFSSGKKTVNKSYFKHTYIFPHSKKTYIFDMLGQWTWIKTWKRFIILWLWWEVSDEPLIQLDQLIEHSVFQIPQFLEIFFFFGSFSLPLFILLNFIF